MSARTGRAVPELERHQRFLPEKPDLIIFDFDGVVADSEVISLHSLRHTLGDFGIDLSIDEVRARYLGVATDKIIREVAAESSAGTSDGFREAWDEVLFDRFRRELAPVPGITDLLDRIEDRGIPFCIASSGSFERIGIALDAIELTDHFEYVFSAELVRNGKPAPDLFLHAAEHLGVEPARCLVIEDSPYGIMAARAAHMLSIGFIGGAHLASIRGVHRGVLLRAGADRIVDSLDDIVVDQVA